MPLTLVFPPINVLKSLTSSAASDGTPYPLRCQSSTNEQAVSAIVGARWMEACRAVGLCVGIGLVEV